jgi:hypothetical protein
MAWCYQICLECGHDRDAAEACIAPLETLLPKIPNAYVAIEALEGIYWAKLNVDHLALQVADWEAIVLRFWVPEFFALPFRFALIGLEVEDACSHDELVAEGLADYLSRIIVCDAMWQDMGRPADLQYLGEDKYGRLLKDRSYG